MFHSGYSIIEAEEAGICSNQYFVDDPNNPSQCICKSNDGSTFARISESSQVFEFSTCPQPKLPERAYLVSTTIEGTQRYKPGVHIVACEEEYYEYNVPRHKV